MKARSVTYSSRSWRARGPVAALRRHLPFARLRWQARTLAWLVTAGLAALAGWQYVVIGPVVFEVALLLVMVRDERRMRSTPGPLPRANDDPAVQAARAEARRQAALPRVASPGGWVAPSGVRPAWNWTPPPGIGLRLDRMPVWARVWYGTPLVDRYAHAWLWHHGGWDVIPPTEWTAPSS